MNKPFFHHLETSSRQEREEIATQLKGYYNTLLYLENEAYHTGGVAYAEALSKLAALQGAFELLGIDFEPGTPFPLSPT